MTPTKLREWRLANGLTQTEAAARFEPRKGKPMSLRTYQRYENGPPSTVLPGVMVDMLILYSAALHAAERKAAGIVPQKPRGEPYTPPPTVKKETPAGLKAALQAAICEHCGSALTPAGECAWPSCPGEED